jgi:hypothetical protein
MYIYILLFFKKLTWIFLELDNERDPNFFMLGRQLRCLLTEGWW